MESRERDVGSKDRESGGPVAELVTGGALAEHVRLKEAMPVSEPSLAYDPNGPLVLGEYVDEKGRWWKVRVPAGSATPASMGIPVGPPDISSLNLPLDIDVRLHNQLFHRGLFTRADLRGRGQEIFAAVQAAYKVDAAAVTALYR